MIQYILYYCGATVLLRYYSSQAPLKVPQRILGPGAGPFLCLGTWDYGLFLSWDLGPDF